MRMDRAATNLPAVAMQLLRGFGMGAADIVPGVSGGTIALIYGIYQQLVDNIRVGAGVLGRLIRLDVGGALERFRQVEWGFLLPLLAGIGVAFLALSHLIEDLLHDYPEEMAGLFLGLVAASVVIAWEQVERWDTTALALLFGVGLLAFVVLGWQGGTVQDPTAAHFLGAGAIAICAMILPGISGSFLLLMMGMYGPLLSAVNERDLGSVGVFMVGAIVGLALFSTLLSWLLDRHGNQVLAALIGLMIGSLRVLWPWPNGVGVISDEESEVVTGTTLGLPDGAADALWPALFAVAAFVLVLGIARFAGRRGEPIDIHVDPTPLSEAG